jgi:CDP-glycerol glycerophosphotransferase (TagB/SpsB family)
MAPMTYSEIGWLKSAVTAIEAVDGVLVMRGWVSVLDSRERSLPIDDVEVVLASENGDERLRAEMSEAPALDEFAVARSGRRETRGFDARFKRPDLRDLAEAIGAKYGAAVRVRSGPYRLQHPLAHPERGPVQRAHLVELDAARTLCFAWEDRGPLYAVVRRTRPIVRAGEVHADRVDFQLELGLRQAGPGRLVVKRLDTGDEVEVPVARPHPLSRTATATVPTDLLGGADLPEDETALWATYYVNARGRRARLSYGSSGPVPRSDAGPLDYCPVLNRFGNLNLHVRPARPWLTAASWDDDATLRVELDVPTPMRPTGVAVRSRERQERYTFPAAIDGGTVTAELRLGGIDKFGERVPLRSGEWNLLLTTEDGDLPVKHSGSLAALLPRETEYRNRTFAITDKGVYGLVVDVGSELALSETGKHNQDTLKRRALDQSEPVEDGSVLYLINSGRQFSCNPAAVFAEMRRRRAGGSHYVVTEDQQVRVPEGATPVPLGSASYFEAIAKARYIVFNSLLPAWWRAQPGQQTVQTWHGFTPAKRIMLDQLKANAWDREKYERKVRNRAAKWDYAVSNSPFASSLIRRSLGFDGPILEIGTPRNDKLFGAYAEAANARIRKVLGVEHGQRIALYAPTWRDQLRYADRGIRLELELDLAALAAALGPEWRLLFRGHHRVVDRLTGDAAAGVVDVSDYPEMQDLLAAADVLVTDYSSSFVDFANTGRPMVFYPYDLEFYRDGLRGFYVDYEETVPGPITRNQRDLADAIRSIDTVAPAYAEKYKRFQADYCTWEDGRAAERLVDFLLDNA